MKKTFVIGAAALLTLTGCVAGTSQPGPTVTVTERAAQPSQPTQTNVREDFIYYMESVGTPKWMLSGESLEILIGQAKNVCEYIDDGDSKDDIIWYITSAQVSSNASEQVVDAIIAASVAATYTYCPQYKGFFN